MKYEVWYGDRYRICWSPREVYEELIDMMGYDVRCPSAHAHMVASAAESWAEIPDSDHYDDSYNYVEIDILEG